MVEKRIFKQHGHVFREHREARNGHRAAVFWFTGLSGSGKSTIAHAVEKRLFDEGRQVYVFDGDNVRHGLCGDLSFSPEARAENIRRIAEVAKLFADTGVVCLCAFISPLLADRARIREIVGDDYREIHVDCPVSVCEARDVKGNYKLAREGKIQNYTGVSAPYDPPAAPDLRIDSDAETLDESVERVWRFIREQI